MKLNQDCIRDLMLYFEENISYSHTVYINKIQNDNYSQEDLIYTAEKLYEAGFIDCTLSRCLDGSLPHIMVKSITYEGHQFLDTIRDNAIWKNTKSKASKLASISIPILQQLATTLIKSQLNLN